MIILVCRLFVGSFASDRSDTDMIQIQKGNAYDGASPRDWSSIMFLWWEWKRIFFL